MAIPAALTLAALALWIAPIPAPLIERWYSRGVYPAWQRGATTASNFAPFAMFDLLLLAAAILLLLIAARARRARSWRYAASRLLLLAGVTGLWFQLAWGLNYRRLPIAETMGLTTTAGSDAALERFATAAADAAAASADQLDRENPLTPSRVLADMTTGFLRAQQKAGLSTFARAGRPKRSLFDFYFQWTAIDGVTNPLIPETILVSGLTPAEVYVTAAHEWAHLAGYASEDEANFVGWLACLEAGAGAQYNAWLFALMKAAGAAPERQRRAWLARAGPIVAQDLAAIRARLQRSSPALRHAASTAYDQFLRANRVEGGIRSYDEVLQLMLAYGTGQ
ncbi:MAG: DUF3810 family protein [Vicinamibacterales bacterium]